MLTGKTRWRVSWYNKVLMEVQYIASYRDVDGIKYPVHKWRDARPNDMVTIFMLQNTIK